MSKAQPVGSIGHAMAHAVQNLGIDLVSKICDRSSSAIYRAINPDDPLTLAWLTLEQTQILGHALTCQNKPEYFSSALRSQIERDLVADDVTVENPITILAESSEHLARGLRLASNAFASGAQADSLREDQAVMIVEALESAVGYAKRAKDSVLRRIAPRKEKTVSFAEAKKTLVSAPRK